MCRPYIKILSVFISFTLFFVVIYSSAIIVTYAFLDDYTLLYYAMRHETSGILQFIVQSGRPLFALIFLWVFKAMHSIADLRYVRAVGIVGIAALATAFYRALECTDLPRALIFAVSLLIGLAPSFEVYAAWGTEALNPWSALLGGLAFTTIGPSRARAHPWPRMAIAFVMLTGALAIHQPAAMMFWLFAGIAWLTAAEAPDWSDVIRAGAVMGAALTAEYALAKGLPLLLYGHANTFQRTALVTNLPQKAVWFFDQPLRDALNLSLIAPRTWIAWTVAAFIAGGLWLYFPGSRITRLTRTALAAILLPLGYLPNLLVAENWSSYRTQSALSSLVWLYTAIALVGWLRRTRLQRSLPIFAVLAVITSAALATRNVMLEFALPQALEYRMVARALRESRLEGATHFYFVLATWSDSLAPVVRYDEFGCPSSSAPWVPTAMAWLILQARHSSYTDVVSSASTVGHGPAPSGFTVIDLAKALRE